MYIYIYIHTHTHTHTHKYGNRVKSLTVYNYMLIKIIKRKKRYQSKEKNKCFIPALQILKFHLSLLILSFLNFFFFLRQNITQQVGLKS
jgi:hypothetical protein